MRSILSGLFLLVALPVFPQVKISLEASTYPFKPAQSYHFSKVSDERHTGRSIGEVFRSDRSKSEVLIQGGIEQAFEQHLRQNLKMNTAGVAIHIKFKEFVITETPGSNGLLNGQIRMELEASTPFDGKESRICTARSSVKFSRSFGTSHEKSYGPLILNLWFSCLTYIDNYINQNHGQIEAFNTGSQIVILPFHTRNSGDTVHYFSRKINWSDFKGSVRGRSQYGAAIFTSIGLKTRLKMEDGKLTAYITPQVFMIPSQSWARESAKDAAALEHEQIHFDLTLVAMNRLMEKLRKLEASSADDLNSMIQYEYLESFKEMNRLQELYDLESQHNLNKPGQLKWKTQVNRWLTDSNL